MIAPVSRIHIRPAHADDATLAAKVIYMSMGGLADYLFDGDARAIESILAKLFARNAGRFGFDVAVVAESDVQPVGMLFSCPGAKLSQFNLDALPHFFPVMGIKHTLKFIWRSVTLPGGPEAEKDEYYVSNLGILPESQGHGFGRALLEYAEQASLANHLTKCSLIVGLHNKNAFHLYQRTGYQVVETAQSPNEHLAYYRMVKQLN